MHILRLTLGKGNQTEKGETTRTKRYKKTSSKFNGKSQDLQALEKGLEAFQNHSRIDTHIGPREPKGKESRNTRRLLQIFCVNTNF